MKQKKRIIEWVKAEAKLKGLVGTTPKVSRAKSLNAGKEASTADVDQALEDYINEQRKEHRGCGSAEVMNNLLDITPDALGALHANATTKEAEGFRARFNNWYQCFRRRRHFCIRRRTSVGQTLPTGHEGMSWATRTKVRKAPGSALVRSRAQSICTRREPQAGGGPDFRAAGVGGRGGFRRTQKHGPDARSARDASRDDSREAWRKGRSHQHSR